MIYPVGSRVKVQEGAFALVYTRDPEHPECLDVQVQSIPKPLEGIVEKIDPNTDFCSPTSYMKVVDSDGNVWIFPKEWIFSKRTESALIEVY